VKKYSLVEDLRQPMPRAPRMQVPGSTNLLDLFYLATSPIIIIIIVAVFAY